MGATRIYALFAAGFLCPPIAVSQQSKLPRLPGSYCAAACPCGACAAVSSKPAVVPPTQTHMHLQVAIARDDLDTYFCKPRCTDLAPLWLAAASVGRCRPAATRAAAATAAAATRSIFHAIFHKATSCPTPPGLNLLLTLFGWLPVSLLFSLHMCMLLRMPAFRPRPPASAPGQQARSMLPTSLFRQLQGVLHAYWVLCTRNPLAGECTSFCGSRRHHCAEQPATDDARLVLPAHCKAYVCGASSIACTDGPSCHASAKQAVVNPSHCPADEDWAGYAALTRPGGTGRGIV